MYPYNIFGMTDDQKSQIPSFYKHGEEYYLEGRVIKDDGSVFSITTTETGLETSRRWEDIYKVVVKLDGSGNPPATRIDRVIFAPTRSQESKDEPVFWGTPESSESVEHYGGDKATDQANKGGYQTFALVGICAVGIYFYFK